MSISDAHTLSELLASEPMTQRELGLRLRLEKSTVSRLVDQLVERGFVVRRPNPADGRSVHVTLTARGREAAGRLRQARTQLFVELVADMSPRDRSLVVDGLSCLEAAARARS